MIVFPNCKINLGLRITGKRDDGYHNLETVFYPLSFHDVLEVIPVAGNKVRFSSTGLTIDGRAENNLCLKAYDLLKRDHPQLPQVQMHLHKMVPLGAGLGGGSADAAFTLQLLNDRFALDLSAQQLRQYALHLGSDCPFFLINKPCFARGRGEILEELAVQLTGYKFILVNPGIHVSTADAFKAVIPTGTTISLKTILQQPVETWKNDLVNDFEQPIFSRYAEIKSIKDMLYDKGAIYAAMSGSGSTVFGIFSNDRPIGLKFPGNYFVKELVS